MQDCLSFGKPLLIENIEEELDPVLDPVLERRYVKKGRGFTVALADKEVSFEHDHRVLPPLAEHWQLISLKAPPGRCMCVC